MITPTEVVDAHDIAGWNGPRDDRAVAGSYRLQRAAKRAIDMLVAVSALLVLSPILLVIAIAIKTTSKGPVFYRSARLGEGGVTFTMYKFRTMIDGADALLDEVFRLNEASGPLFKSRSDPRVTTVGRFLRKHYLDEVPQLINVALGDMALVGPRPCLPTEARDHMDHLEFRFAVPQGITGPWQINGHHGITFEEQLRVEQAYVENWSVGTDIRILAKTVPLVIRRTGF
jgi:lipopolysaccharide/colanic/teichoic acid biosynthesis glycosyltransferase